MKSKMSEIKNIYPCPTISKIIKNRHLIFMAEIGALLHDLGKLSKFFIEHHLDEAEKEDHISKRYLHGDILEYDSRPNNDFYPNDKELEKLAEYLKKLLENIKVGYPTEPQASNLYSFIKEHHHESQNIVELLKVSDSFDADEDRKYAKDEQSKTKIYKSTVFGYEKEIDVDFNVERKKVYTSTIKIIKKEIDRYEFLDILKESFGKALGMTARAANDVSLWNHSYMTACVMKSLLCESILKNEFPVVKNKKEMQNNKKRPFRILSVGWDFFEFISQSHKIPDIIGRTMVLEEIKKEVKRLIEVDLMLGNCIYEDDHCLHFLIPASFDEEKIIREKIYEIVKEKTRGILIPYVVSTGKEEIFVELLPKAKNELENKMKQKEIDPEYLKSSWIEEWRNMNTNPSKKRFICNVCGKGYYDEDEAEKICETCKEIRNKGREEESCQSRFIDEIAWNGNNYENVALVVLNFNLDEWLNGKYISMLYMRKAIDENRLFDKKIGKKVKEIIMGKVGPKISKKECLSADEINAIKKDIKEELKNHCIFKKDEHSILNCDAEKIEDIVDEIINYIKNIPADEINEDLDNILTKIGDNYIVLTKKQDVHKKNPSPSRVMRVWNNTAEFFRELEKEFEEMSYCVGEKKILLEYENKDKNILESMGDGRAYEIEIFVKDNTKDNKINGEAIFEDNKDKYYLLTVTPHVNNFIEKNKDKELNIKIVDEERKVFCNVLGKFDSEKRVRGYRTISLSPNMFMFLVSSSNVIEIIKETKKRYIEEFGKVYGKLPFNILVIFFKRKTPFYVVLDGAKRLMNCFKNEKMKKEILFSVKCVSVKNDTVDLKISSANRETEILPYEISVPYKLGDESSDYYHPFVRINKSNTEEKHVLCIKKDDEILVDPSYFEFEFLDTSVERFRIFANDEVKRCKHSILGKEGTKLYYLEDFDNFIELLEILNKNKITSSQINNLSTLLTSKIYEWNIKDNNLNNLPEFVDLVEDSIANIFGIRKKVKPHEFDFIKNAILSGIFFDVVELYLKIIKEER